MNPLPHWGGLLPGRPDGGLVQLRLLISSLREAQEAKKGTVALHPLLPPRGSVLEKQ